MRNAFADEMTRLAGADPRVVLLSGDIGNRLFDPYKAAAPERFFNAGVAEANMIGMAAGMALSGLRPVAYTITPFITTRCLEQIRVDVCYHRAPVVIVGVGSGLGYASLGATHHSCEDMAFLRALPGMTVIAPADAWEVRAALRAALAHDGPVYLRIGKKGEPPVHTGVPADFAIGRGLVVDEGDGICLLAAGTILPVARDAAALLRDQGFSVRLVSLHTVKPLDTALLEDSFARFRTVATVEEHSLIGGLGGAVAEWLADRDPLTAPPVRARLARFGTRDEFLHTAGKQGYARAHFGLTADAIAGRLAALAAA